MNDIISAKLIEKDKLLLYGELKDHINIVTVFNINDVHGMSKLLTKSKIHYIIGVRKKFGMTSEAIKSIKEAVILTDIIRSLKGSPKKERFESNFIKLLDRYEKE